jgi:hypothetical protein
LIFLLPSAPHCDIQSSDIATQSYSDFYLKIQI